MGMIFELILDLSRNNFFSILNYISKKLFLLKSKNSKKAYPFQFSLNLTKFFLFSILLFQKVNSIEISEGFFFPVETDFEDDEELKKADLLFDAKFIDKAIESYEKIIIDNERISSESNFNALTTLQAKFHLALLYVSEKRYNEAILVLKNIDYTDQKILTKQNSLFLLGIAYKSIQNLGDALKIFEQYISQNEAKNLKLYHEGLFQIGLIKFELKDYDAAKETFLKISLLEDNRLSILASFYVARIDLIEKKYESAEAQLEKIALKIPVNEKLSYELSFLLGEVSFQSQEYLKAIAYLNHSLQYDHPNANWYSESLYQLGWSHYRLAENLQDKSKNYEEIYENLKKSEDLFVKLIEDDPSEKGYLALAECYLLEAKLIKPEYFDKADALLQSGDHFQTNEGKARSILLRAEAARTYEKRNSLYRELTLEKNSQNLSYADSWYMHAMNDFEEGQRLKIIGNFDLSRKLLSNALQSFGKASELYKDKDSCKLLATIKYQAVTTSLLQDEESDFLAFKIIDNLIHENPKLFFLSPNQDEFLYLHGFFASKLIKKDPSYFQIALKSLEAAKVFPNGMFEDISLKVMGILYFDNEQFEKAEIVFLELVDKMPNSSHAGESLFWSARCGELLKRDEEIIAERKKRVFENYSSSPYAQDAYFTLYTYKDYLQGDKQTIKHLQNFEDKFSSSPYLIEAYYLIGLDFIRDRKTKEGKWIRKRSMTEAIDAFQHVETLYDSLKESHQIPSQKKEYYTAIRFRSTLHRAMANLAIAEEAKGAKQHIYLEYAEEVFKNLIKDLEDPQKAFIGIIKKNSHPNIYEEANFGLAKTYVMANNDEKADQILQMLIEYYNQAEILQGYYLARSFDERGRIASRKNEYKLALEYFNLAESASRGKYLSTDQKLDLWINQALCFRGLKEYDDAILILSKVINDDAISALRIQAMYLRAETYEIQGRPELAKKQLESIVRKGGSFAKKATEKLEKKYGY